MSWLFSQSFAQVLNLVWNVGRQELEFQSKITESALKSNRKQNEVHETR